MKAAEIAPENRLRETLPGSDFADAYWVDFPAPAADARSAGLAMFDSPPAWVNALMGLRNQMVRPFGLKAGHRELQPDPDRRIGIFPLLRQSQREVLAGLDDRHLDFRAAITVEPSGDAATRVTVTTVVRTHNRLGRIYLALIMPFHRLIVRGALERAARNWR